MSETTPLDKMTLAQFIEELQSVADDEANGITDVPVDDLLHAAAQRLQAQEANVQACLNDKNRAEGQLEARLQDILHLKEDLAYVQESADRILKDLDEVLEAMRNLGYTEWVDHEGVVHPIPVPWDVFAEGMVPDNPPNSKPLTPSYPPTVWAPKRTTLSTEAVRTLMKYEKRTPEKLDPEAIRSLLAYAYPKNDPYKFGSITET